MDLFFGVYYGPREELVESCSERLISHFDLIEKSFPFLLSWKKRGGGGTKLDFNKNTPAHLIREVLLAGTNRKDDSGDSIPELGLRAGFWNGLSSVNASSTSILCGAYSRKIEIVNNALLQINDWSQQDAESFDYSTFLRALALIWNADRGVCKLNGQIVANLA